MHASSMMPTRLGQYEVRAKIAEGGMAIVYLGRLAGPAGFERVVALKVIRDQFAMNPDFTRMFLDEAKIVARMQHPNVVQVHELGMEGDRLFIAMELLFGVSLWHVWEACRERQVRLRYDLMAWLGARIAEGLHHAHEMSDPMTGQKLEVIHRDINPTNILVTYDGQPKIIDFGLARAAGRIEQTAAGVIKGKLAYMSPEQAMGARVDRRTDIFALGTTLWELTVDRRLFKKKEDVETLRAVVDAKIPDPRTLVMGYPDALWRVLERSLQKDKGARYQTALEMARDLDACAKLEGRVVTAQAVGEVMHALFANERERQRKWIGEASSAVVKPPTDMLRPPPGTPLPNAGVPHAPGVFAETDPDAPTLYYVPKPGEVDRRLRGLPLPARVLHTPVPPPPPDAPMQPMQITRPTPSMERMAATGPMSAMGGSSNRGLWIAVGVLALLLVGVLGFVGYLLATR